MADTPIFFVTFYCNRFFDACQEKFCSFHYFFEKYFKRIDNCAEKTADPMPKFFKYRAQKPPDSLVPKQDTAG
jgi:hypothetical protein